MFLQLIVVLCASAAAGAEYGFRMPQITRVVGGKNAHSGQFPYQVSLQIQYPGQYGKHFCGGSILTERLIITAAHCIVFVLKRRAENNFVVTAGIIDFQSRNSIDEQTVKVEKFYRNSKYVAGTLGLYDIGVLVLASPLKFNGKVAPIVLPKAGDIHDGRAILSGWGRTRSPKTGYPHILQYAELPLVPYPICKAVYDSHLSNNRLYDTNVCSGPLSGGQSACNADSGGPLVQRNRDGKHVLIGVVSWGLEPCGKANSPSVYTRVSAYIDYINGIKALH